MGISFLLKIVINSGIVDKYPNLIMTTNQINILRDIGIVYKENNPLQENILEFSKFLTVDY